MRRLSFYSDCPDIVVELDPPEGDTDVPVTMFLQLSIDEH